MSVRENVTLDQVIQFLNEVIELDPEMFANLIEQRVLCNDGIAHHPTIQVGGAADGNYVGFLGLLNGIFGVYDDGPKAGWGPITVILEGTKTVRVVRSDV